MGRKLGRGSAPFWGGAAGSPSNTVAWAEAYLHTKWLLDRSSHLAKTDIGRKLEGAVPLGGGGVGSSSNTMWPGPRPICTTSFILIRQPFSHNTPTLQAGRADRTDNGLMA